MLDKVESMLQNAHKHPVTTILNKKQNKDYLDLFHSQLVPVDKAGNNIGIICKTFYLNILYKRLRNLVTLNLQILHLLKLQVIILIF